MSKVVTPDGEDFPEAAKRHLVSAQLLLGVEDCTAAYLAGYVVECCYKSVLFLDTGNKKSYFGHLSEVSSKAVKFLGVNGSLYSKYNNQLDQLTRVMTLQTGVPLWNPGIRYMPSSFITPKIASKWVGEADMCYTSVINLLRLDGHI